MFVFGTMGVDAELEKLYMPSQWSKRYEPDVIIQKHLEICKNQNENLANKIPCQLDLSYGSRKPRETINIFGTDLPKESPILMFIHGGYWMEPCITPDLYYFIAEPLYKNGIKTVFIGYELCPNVTLQQLVSNVQIAFTQVLNYAKNCNAKGLFISGHSAGAHIVLSLVNFIRDHPDSDIVKDLIPIAGIYDLVPLLRTSVNEALQLSESEAAEFSPMHYKVHDIKRNLYIIAAEWDSPQFVKESQNLAEKLSKTDKIKTAEFITIKEVDHFNIIEKLADSDFELTKLIIKVCKS